MARLFIAADTAGPSLWFGLSPFGHLQVVFEPSTGSSLVEAEIQSPAFFGTTGEPWVFQTWGKPHNVPDMDSGEEYGRYELRLAEGQSAEHVWELMRQVDQHLRSTYGNILNYDTSGIDIGFAFESQNSNSYVRTLLDVIGNTRDWEEAFVADGMTSFPGYNRNVLKNLTGLGDNGATLVVAGTPGNDIIIGGNNNDSIGGQAGDDTLSGGAGDDTLTGGPGEDLFLGAPDELNGDTITDLEIGDRIGVSGATVDEKTLEDVKGRDTSVTFSTTGGLFGFGADNISIKAVMPAGAGLRLSEETLEDGGSIIEVVAVDGHDIAFVVDTTGSMWDDIDAVQAQASSIINAIFDPARGLMNSRIAVVGYNDPFTETFLSFTDHEDIEDRKEAALNAINSLYASGGGDFEEMVYSGLLRALDGRAGAWREDALASRIFLFGDASAKDTELRDRVLQLAANVGVDVSVSARAVSMTESVSHTILTLAVPNSEAQPISVEIFTIVVGDDSTTRDEFAFLASETGGEALLSADATEIADILFDAIQAGTAFNDILIGNSRPNFFDGRSGDDNISGNDGNDTLWGGEGNDTVSGGNGNDRILDGLGNNVLDGGDDDDNVQALSGVNSIEGGSGSDYLAGGFQADYVSGGAGNDVLRGDLSIILGGSDTLIGGAGDDFLMGGRGADTFVFNTNDGADTIAAFNVSELGYGPLSGYTATATGADFQPGIDLIQLRGFDNVSSMNVLDFVSNSPNGARFSAEGTDILFFGVAASQLSSDDFLFSAA